MKSLQRKRDAEVCRRKKADHHIVIRRSRALRRRRPVKCQCGVFSRSGKSKFARACEPPASETAQSLEKIRNV
jgi:hypothetical protein